MSFSDCTDPENTTHRNNGGFTLAHRLLRWANIKPTLCQCVVFAVVNSVVENEGIFDCMDNNIILYKIQRAEIRNYLILDKRHSQ